MKSLFIGTAVLVVSPLFIAAESQTPEGLFAEVIKGVEAKDQQALKALAIDEAEIKKFVWPTVVSRMAGNGMNGDKFASGYAKSSELGIASVFAAFGGRKWQIVKVAMEAPQKQSKDYKLFPAPLVTLRDESGQEKTTHLVGGVLEQKGAYKVATYYTPIERQ